MYQYVYPLEDFLVCLGVEELVTAWCQGLNPACQCGECGVNSSSLSYLASFPIDGHVNSFKFELIIRDILCKYLHSGFSVDTNIFSSLR